VRFGFVLGLLLAVVGLQAQPAPEESDTPADVVTALHTGLVAAAGEGASNLAERYSRLSPLVQRTHDLRYIARVTIRRQWDTLTADEQQRFLTAFERLSVMTYANRFANVSADAFELLDSEDAGSGRVLVHSTIVRESGDISLDYLLHNSDGSWRIINILADQVSDLALKRAEYQRILSAGSIEDLIGEIEAQTKRLE
jgi:phospholipid transport system substrate-binding protein